MSDSLICSEDVDSRMGKKIAGDLFAQELVEGDVSVEGPDQVVPEAPRSFGRDVPFIAVGVGVTYDIHPMPRPAFTEVGRGQQAIDRVGVSARARVAQKGADILGFGRQAGQHEAKPAQKSGAAGSLRGGEAVLFKLREDETVDVLIRPLFLLDTGNRRAHNGLQTPPAAPLAERLLPRLLDDRRCRGRIARIGRPHAYPTLERRNDSGSQFLAPQRHRRRGALMPDGSNERAQVDIAGYDRRPGHASLLPTAAVVEPQVPLRPFPAVADRTILDQGGTNLAFKEFQCGGTEVLGISFRRMDGPGGPGEESHDDGKRNSLAQRHYALSRLSSTFQVLRRMRQS